MTMRITWRNLFVIAIAFVSVVVFLQPVGAHAETHGYYWCYDNANPANYYGCYPSVTDCETDCEDGTNKTCLTNDHLDLESCLSAQTRHLQGGGSVIGPNRVQSPFYGCKAPNGEIADCLDSDQECQQWCDLQYPDQTCESPVQFDTYDECQAAIGQTGTEGFPEPDGGQQATQPTDSGVCSGDRCTRADVGVFMQNVQSGCYNRGNCSLQDIQIVFVNVSNFVLSIVGSLAFLFYIIGGIMFLTAGGSQKQISRGKDMLKYATVGLLIVLVAFAGIQWLTNALGVESEFLDRTPFG